MPLETCFASWPAFLATCAILIVAEGVYVMFGFGAGLIAVGSLALLLPDLQDVVVLLLLVNVGPETWVVACNRRRIEWRGVGLLLLGVAVGIPVGTRLLTHGDASLVLTALGVFLVLAGGAFLWLGDRKPNVPVPPWSAPPVGLAAGVLTGTFGTGGPPVILYHRLRGLTKSAFRGNLMALFLVMGLMRLPVYLAAGLLTRERLLSALATLPAVVLGAWLGNRIHLRLDEGRFRRLVSALLVVLGVGLLLRG